jgi:site-specific DNA-methyltransferase (adenine-specific)
MAMFPPALPHYFIRWLTNTGEVVYDPFSGRGTTALEACLLGRVGLGSDASPLACVLSGAKTQPPRATVAAIRLGDLRKQYRAPSTAGVPDHVRILFNDKTLKQLVWLRKALNLGSRTDRYLMAVLLGILHLNARKDGTPRGLSVAMPNTFAMAPGYVSRYVKTHSLKPPEVNVFDALEARVRALGSVGPQFRPGRMWRQDVRRPIRWPANTEPAKLVFTSPPYLQVMKYGKMNWLRLWMLGEVPAEVDAGLFASASVQRYLGFMSEALRSIRSCVRDDGYVCLVIGDVRKEEEQINLAQQVAESCVAGTGLRVLGLVDDHLPVEHKVSRIWGATKGRATKVDRILILGGPRVRRLPREPRIDWLADGE